MGSLHLQKKTSMDKEKLKKKIEIKKTVTNSDPPNLTSLLSRSIIIVLNNLFTILDYKILEKELAIVSSILRNLLFLINEKRL